MTTKGKSEKANDSTVLPFGSTPYGTEEAISSVTLLASTEENVILKAIYNLCKYAQQSAANVKFLFDLGLMEKLLPLLGSTNQSICNFSLKLLGMVLDFPAAVRQFTDYENFENIMKINSIFKTSSDPKTLEFSSQILSKAVTNTVISSMLFNTEVIGPIFKVLEDCSDPDIVKNTLKYLCQLLDCQEAELILPKIKEFSPTILFCYLKSEFPEIQHLAMDVLITTTSWKNQALQTRYRDSGIVQSMLNIIMNNEYPDLHQKGFDVIRNSFDSEITSTYFIGTVEFLEFALWAKKCPKKYMLCAATIFKVLTDYESAKQLLFDFSVEESILSMFRTNNEKVLQKTCEAISNLTSHKYCCDKMLTPVIIKSLVDILLRQDIPTIPYIESALKTVYDFLKRNRKMLEVFPLYGGLDAITKILKSQSEMTHSGFTVLLDIIYRYCYEDKYRSNIIDKESYMKILQLFTEPDMDFSKKAVAILDQCIKDQECRVYFLELSGPDRIIDKLKGNITDDDFLKYILIFISRAFIYKRIGMELLKKEILTVLKSIRVKNEEIVFTREKIINMMLDIYLPLKFFERNRLEVTDCVRDLFYLVCGCWKGPFPFLEVLESQQISTCKTIFVTDFTTPSDLLKTPCISCVKSTDGNFNETKDINKENVTKDNRQYSRKRNSSVVRKSVSGTNICNIIYERTPPNINYGGLSPDPYLTEYLEELYYRLHGEKASMFSVTDQIRIIAEFVSRKMSGSAWYPEDEKLHAYKLHINNLKNKLGTNMIPIGYIREGSFCERALLFKVLADKLAIPTTLVKGMKEMHWNEVPLDLPDQPRKLVYHVVDLMFDVGNLMTVGSAKAKLYCGSVTEKPCYEISNNY